MFIHSITPKKEDNDAQTHRNILDGYFDASFDYCQGYSHDGTLILHGAESIDLNGLLAEMPN